MLPDGNFPVVNQYTQLTGQFHAPRRTDCDKYTIHIHAGIIGKDDLPHAAFALDAGNLSCVHRNIARKCCRKVGSIRQECQMRCVRQEDLRLVQSIFSCTDNSNIFPAIEECVTDRTVTDAVPLE